MTSPARDLRELVATVLNAGDPTLLERTCAALHMILADYNDRPTL